MNYLLLQVKKAHLMMEIILGKLHIVIKIFKIKVLKIFCLVKNQLIQCFNLEIRVAQTLIACKSINTLKGDNPIYQKNYEDY